MKVYGYTRVNAAPGQAKDGDSFESQRNQVIGYAMINGWEVATIFEEGAVNGSVPLADRPAGGKLLAAVANGDMIITPKLDRIFRGAMDGVVTIESLRDRNIGLHMIDPGGDVTGTGNASLIYKVLVAVAGKRK